MYGWYHLTVCNFLLILIISDDESQAHDVAKSIASNYDEAKNHYHESHEDWHLHVYIKHPHKFTSYNPRGPIDVLLIQIANKDENLTAIQEFVEISKQTPVILLLSDDENLAKDFRAYSTKTDENIKEKAIKLFGEHEDRLTNVWSKYDTTNSGTINFSNLNDVIKGLKASNEEEIEQIRGLLSNYDNIVSLDDLKIWRRFGNEDFARFAKLFRDEREGRTVFGKIMKGIQDYIHHNETGEKSNEGRFEFSPIEDFEAQVGISAELFIGDKVIERASHLPHYMLNAPYCISFEISTSDKSTAESLAEFANAMIPNLLESVPSPFKELLQNAKVVAQACEDKICINAYYSTGVSEYLNYILSQFSTATLNFNCHHKFELGFGLKLTDILTNPLDNLLQSLFNFKIKGTSDMDRVKTFADALINQLFNIKNLKLNSGADSARKVLLVWSSVLRFFSAIKHSHMDIHYDPSVLVNLAKEGFNLFKPLGQHIEENQFNLISDQLSNTYQPMLTGQIDMFKGMAGEMLGPLKDMILGLNLDNIKVSLRAPQLKVEVDLSVVLNGVTEFVRNFLS